MMSKYHQHAILTGCVDSFCLVCECHLRSEEDAGVHIEKPVHLKNLGSCPYLGKFNIDQIRKVKKGYFCEFCNLLLPTSAKVGLHVTEPSHNDNKGVQLIKRIGNHVVVFGNIMITEHAWNGLISDTCAVCNMEFNNLKLHIADQKHVLNLIQRKVEFGIGSTIVYRKIDDTSFHCLICNSIFALSTATSHYKDDIHVSHVDKCRKCYHAYFETNSKSEIKNGFQNGKNDCVKSQVDDDATSSVEAPKIMKCKQNPKTGINNSGSVGSGNKSNTKQSNEDALTVDKTKLDQKENKPAGIQTGKASKDLNTSAANRGKDIKNTQRDENKDKLFENVNEFAKNGVNINFETETAFCKKCFESVDLDLEVIKRHIVEHKSSPKKEATANTVHTLNEKCSKTALNSKEKEDQHVTKASVNFDQNHNVTKDTIKDSSQEEEIIKIDLRKATEVIEESENAIMRYVPGPSNIDPQKSEETPKPAKKDTVNMNDPGNFAKHNNITYNKGNGNAFCRICSKKIPAAIKNMQEHVAGMSHKTKIARIAELDRAAKVISKKPMGSFIYHTSSVMDRSGVDDVILNDKFCLTRMSYYMITTQNRLRCQACEVNLREEDVGRHVDGAWHERAMEKTPVVTRLNSEFVREVRTELYHCGYCNLIVGSWEDVSSHLKCSEHEESKRAAVLRREEHMPDILAYRAQREDLFAIGFLRQFFPFF